MHGHDDRDEMKTLLVSLLYGEIEPAERVELERHLEGCAECREELASLEQVRALLAEKEPLVPELPARTVTVLPARVPRAPLWAAAASLLLAGALAVFAFSEATLSSGPEGFRLSFAGEPATATAVPVAEPAVDQGELRALVLAEARREARRTVQAALDERESRDLAHVEEALLTTLEDRQSSWESRQREDLQKQARWTQSVVEYALLSSESPRLVEK